MPIAVLLVFRGLSGYVVDEFLVAFIVLLVSLLMLGYSGVFSSLLHFMLPRKRAGEEGAVVEEETDNTNNVVINNNNNINVQTAGASLIKKHRIDICAVESNSNSNSKVAAAAAAATATTANNIQSDGASLIMALGNSNPPDIDEDLHSRQLAVYGRETMRKLSVSNVLISGMQGLGAEIGKY